MTNITIKYLGNRLDTPSNGFHSALGKQAMRVKYIDAVQDAIKRLDAIDMIIEIVKKVKNEEVELTKNTVFIITIDTKEYYLSNRFELMDDEEFKRADFAPHVEFDKSNADIAVEEKNLNDELKYKTSDNAIEMIEIYCDNPSNRYKHISHKPTQISLYHRYDTEPIVLDMHQ